MDSLKTGDVILYSRPTSSWLSSITGMLSRNNTNKNKTEYLHCGMILRDPVFVHSSLKGLYVWQTKWTHTLDKNEDESSESESDSESEQVKGENTETAVNTSPMPDLSVSVDSNTNTDSNETDGLNADDLVVEIVPLKQILDECDCPNITARFLSSGTNSLSTDELHALHATITEDPKNIFPQEEIRGVLGYCDLSSYDWSATFLGYLYTKCNLLSKETHWHLLRSQDFASDTENLRFAEGVSLDNDEVDLA
tara:strand:+ start:1294 stop:2049 length:756 start_codon:yes stop_codon:yes gene_type:complete